MGNKAVTQFIEIASKYVGVTENPLGSNRGTQIDEWNKAVGVPVGSFWCASFVSAVVRKWEAQTGLDFPTVGSASCDSWFSQAKSKGLLTRVPKPGHILLVMKSTDSSDAIHIGICGHESNGLISSIEGNSNNDGSANGTMVALRKNHLWNRSALNVWYIDWSKGVKKEWVVEVNGKSLDVKVIDDTVYVPIRSVAGALDIPITTYLEEKKIIVEQKNTG
jgi:hypothetical protein